MQQLPLDGALRYFFLRLASQLPREASFIDILLETMTGTWVSVKCQRGWNESEYAFSADVAYVLSYSLIMFNTDAHNPHIREEMRMSPQQFCRSNRGIGGSVEEDPPQALLESMCHSLQQDKIHISVD
jgi:Sec7-like guanine-nucleotide exchange factor